MKIFLTVLTFYSEKSGAIKEAYGVVAPHFENAYIQVKAYATCQEKKTRTICTIHKISEVGEQMIVDLPTLTSQKVLNMIREEKALTKPQQDLD